MTESRAPETVADDSGINLALLAALPPARRVLELGCATGRLGQRYKRAHPDCTWIGVDVSDAALDAARPHLDGVVKLDLDVDAPGRAGTGFDLFVLGDVLEHLKAPETLLRDLLAVGTPDARLVCCVPNMSHVSVIERLVRGDIMYDPIGLLDATHLRFLAPRSAFKMLLDAGWLPAAAGGYARRPSQRRFRHSDPGSGAGAWHSATCGRNSMSTPISLSSAVGGGARLRSQRQRQRRRRR